MSSISMCSDFTCPRFARCLRTRSDPGVNQQWLDPMRNVDTDQCEYFISSKEEKAE